MATDKTTDTTADVPSVSDALDALLAENDPAPAADPTPEPEPSKEADTELDPAPEPEADPEPAAEPAAAEPDDLSELAEEAISYYGLSQEEVDKAGDLLPWVLARMDKQASALMQGHPNTPDQPQPPEPAPAPVAAREPEKTQSPLTDLPAFDLLINRDDFDEGSLKVFDTLKDEINTQRSTVNEHRKAMQMVVQALVETRQIADELRSQTQSSSAAEYGSAMDDFFAKLPDDYVDIYGREPMSQLAQNSPKVAARHALEKEMNILQGFDAKGGRPTRGTKEQAARTLRALHADKAHVAARREVDKQLKTRAAKGIARPSGRGNAKPTDLASRRTRAMAAMDGPLAKLGLL